MTTAETPAIIEQALPDLPPIRLTIKVNDEEKTIKMTYGLLNQICRGLGGVMEAFQLAVVADLRDFVAYITLSDRDDEGNITKPFNPNTMDISVEDGEALNEWVSGHAVHFFLKAMKGLVARQANSQALKDLAAEVRANIPSTTSSTGTSA